MDLKLMLQNLKLEIEKDLKVCTDPDDNQFHLTALDAVEFLLDQYL